MSRTGRPARLLGALLDPWLPASCIVCASDDPGGMCPSCEDAMPGYRVPRCPRCAIGAASQEAPCGECLLSPPEFDRTIVLADYAAPLDRVVHALKFGRDASLAAPLGRALARAVQEELASTGYDGGVVAAIPLSTARLAERGFNQSLEIARAFAKALSIPLDRRLLRRVRESAPASTLHAGERRRALQGAFACDSLRERRCVLLVDDVMTTGATLHEAARTLRAAGASIVINCVIARTPAADDPRRPRPPRDRTQHR